jgi:hypothetical protein|tara:strand:+ start:64 stop:603 length:540 start_codon:yes stop_codon:yes gene_type:complete
MKIDLENKINESRSRLKADLSRIEALQQSYPLYFAYLAFIGLFIFDFLKQWLSITQLEFSISLVIFFLSSILTLIFLVVSISHFVKLIYPLEIAHEPVPEKIYKEHYKSIEEWTKRQDGLNLEEQFNESYLELLETAVSENFVIFKQKRKDRYEMILFALISILPYIIAIISFKIAFNK